jgi:chaperonin cofactor prefoldin
VTGIFLEGRIDSERATHALRSAKAEIAALSDDWRVAKDVGRIIHLVKR